MAQTAPKRLTFTLGDVSFDFFIAAHESIISQTVERTGAWEAYQLSHYREWIPADGVFIDVGANVGINSLFARFAVPASRVVAVEPGPDNLTFLHKNTAGMVIEIFPVALGREAGRARFTDADNTRGKFSVTGEHEVEVTTLDRLCAENGITGIDLLKIDVEGYADHVLDGAGETLPKVERAIVEFSFEDVELRLQSGRQGAADYFTELHARMVEAFGHSYYISREDGLIEISAPADIFEMMALEHNVADILFTRRPEPSARTVLGFMAGRIAVLLTQNHHRIQEIARLNEDVAALRKSLAERQ